ncbi:MAG: sel1 repeat family protein [Myxococcales bacterium]|nr:sel1 repeat family protein [Myxococcales bacterium]
MRPARPAHYLFGDLPHDAPAAAAEELLKRACDGDYANGCHDLAVLYAEGHVEGADLKEGLPFYERACALGDGESCGTAASWHLNGHRKSGVPEDFARALELGMAGCELGDAWSCYSAGLQHFMGWGVPEDAAAALPLAGKACRQGSKYGCKLKKKAQKRVDRSG